MKLPADFKEVINEAINIDAARQLGVSVSVIIDETAPADIVAHVRSLFASAAPHARITVGYLDTGELAFSPSDDVVILIAGLDVRIGAKASEIRAQGVPVMVVTTLFDQVKRLAEESGYPIPQGDLISPELNEEDKSRAQEAFEAAFGKISAPDAIELTVDPPVGCDAQGADRGDATTADAGEKALDVLRGRTATARMALLERARGIDLAKFLKRGTAGENERPSLPNLLGEQAKRALNNRMGEWIIETCREKRLSFALAFPFVARPLSLEAVNATAVQNAGIGVVVFLPGADMPVMTANQMKMILQIAAAYGQPMTVERVKELLVVLGGAFVARSAARSVAGVVPGLGWAVKGAVGYAATLAMGRAAIEYFENGMGLMGATGAVVSAKNAVVGAVEDAIGVSAAPEASAQEKNQQAAQAVKNMASSAAVTGKRLLQAAGPLGRQVAASAARSFKDGISSMMK